MNYLIGFIDTSIISLRDSLNKSVKLQSYCTNFILQANSFEKEIQDLQKLELGALLFKKK